MDLITSQAIQPNNLCFYLLNCTRLWVKCLLWGLANIYLNLLYLTFGSVNKLELTCKQIFSFINSFWIHVFQSLKSLLHEYTICWGWGWVGWGVDISAHNVEICHVWKIWNATEYIKEYNGDMGPTFALGLFAIFKGDYKTHWKEYLSSYGNIRCLTSWNEQWRNWRSISNRFASWVTMKQYNSKI